SVELKRELSGFLEKKGVKLIDAGPENSGPVDYPDFGAKVSRMVSSGQVDRGILICGTGIGMSIVANKFPGVRAALCGEPVSARLSRQHNDSNILALGSRLVGSVMALEILKVWLETPFEGGRHAERLMKITTVEEKYSKG
ncbi:MAG: ribose 5-phosphate isomerase B, partial [Nitrospiraceae bacterium]|nr:ribose 5-phosphate isomerase B [Nitrospiraceae bacterium]